MLKLPRPHLSVSQINLWETDQTAYMKRYFLNIDDESSPMLTFGKQFATDIEDYSKGEQREFNFPPNFLENILLYPRVEHKLEHHFGNFMFLGYIDNASQDFNIIRDFKTGTAAWTQERLKNSLQMKAYSLILFQQDGILPTCFIDYYKTKLKNGKIEWTDVHETYQHTFTMQDLAQTETRIRKAANEIAEAYELYLSDELKNISKLYIETDHQVKINTELKDFYRKKMEELLKDKRYVNIVYDKILNYSTYEKKSYTYSVELMNREELLAEQKKQEIEDGIAQEQVKTISLLTVRDVK
jgi:hypothetical protein